MDEHPLRCASGSKAIGVRILFLNYFRKVNQQELPNIRNEEQEYKDRNERAHYNIFKIENHENESERTKGEEGQWRTRDHTEALHA